MDLITSIHIPLYIDEGFKIETYVKNINPNKDITININASKIHNYGIFYTDSNGLDMIVRSSLN